MSEEKIYTFNNYVLSYDCGQGDESCLLISKIKDNKIYLLAELHNESASLISTMLDNLQQEHQQLKSVLNEVRDEIIRWF